MADTVEIAGKRVNKWVVYGGVAGVGIVGFLWWKNRNGSSSASGQNASATDPVTGLPYSEDNQVDPATGMTYLAEAQQYGSVAAAEAAVGAGYGGVSGVGGGYSGVGAGYPTQTYTTGSATGTSAQFATNADWAQEVIAQIPSVTGDSASDVATAVANYLAGLALNATQANDIQVALAEFGPPPVGSFQIITAGSGSGPTSTGSGSSGGSGHGPGPQAKPPAAPAWVAEQWVKTTQANVHWARSAGATSYEVRVTYQSKVQQVDTTSAENYTISGLTPDHTYGVHVVAVNSAGRSAETSTTVKTQK